MQPEALINLPAKTGFMDRHIMLDPLDIKPYFKDRRNPPDDVITLEEILNAVYQTHNSGSKEYTMDDSARNLYAEFHTELASRPWIAREKNQDDIKGESPGKSSNGAKVLLATMHINQYMSWE